VARRAAPRRLLGGPPTLSRCLPAVLVLAPLAAAGTLHVPGDFETIQAAVNAALEGDTILVAKGDYPGAVIIDGLSGLVLRAKGRVTIQAGSALVGLRIEDSSQVEVSGFRVEDATEMGIFVRTSSDVTVRKCTVTEDCSVAAIAIDQGTRVCELLRNVIEGTSTDGIVLKGTGNLVECNDVIGALGTRLLESAESSANVLSRNLVLVAHVGIEIGGDGGTSLDHNRVIDVNGRRRYVTSDVDATGNQFTACKASKCLQVGFGVKSAPNTFTECKAKGSGGFDLADTSLGLNSCQDCSFGMEG